MTAIATTPTLDQDSIATRAYYLWEAEGRPDGCNEAHWFAAEAAEKRSVTARRAAATRKPKAAASEAATSKASPKTVVAAAALSKTRGSAAGAKGSRRVH